MANSTDTVAQLNRLAQHTRIRIGELDPDAPRMRGGDGWILVGDEVVTRRNDRTLTTDRGLMVKNRDHWTITTIHPDHSVTLTGRTGTIRLPAHYVAEDLELGYAQTSHATQGRTVDTALLLSRHTHRQPRRLHAHDPRTRQQPRLRRRRRNQTAHDVLTQAITRDWIDQPAVVRKAQLDPHHTRQREPAVLGEEDQFDKLEQRVHRLIEERRRARAREAERTAGRGLELDIN